MNETSKLKQDEWSGSIISNQRTGDRTNYPASPSAGHGILKKYEELLLKVVENKPNFKACVLGSTPELRDLVLKYGGELTSIDISTEMIIKVTNLLKYNNSSETIVRGDWLKNPLSDNYFDIILGDGVSNNISYKDQNRFFEQLARILKLDGNIILREVGISTDRKIKTVEEINMDFENEKIHWFDLLFEIYFYSDLTPKCTDSQTKRWYMRKLFKEIENAYIEGRLSKKAIESLWWFKNNLIHTMYPKFELISNIQRNFQLIPTQQVKDYQFTQDTFLFYFGKVKK